MKKILTGIFLIALTVGLVSGAAYALFSDTVQVNNLAITTGNADLKISVDDGKTWADSYNQGPWLDQGVAPGYEKYVPFKIWNNSASSISLDLSTQLTSATGDWGTLNSTLLVKFTDGDGNPLGYGGYGNLSWWNGANRGLAITLGPDATQDMRMYLSVPTGAGNSIANKWISTNWLLTGTQHP